MTRWALMTGPELVPDPIDPKRYKQIIAEIGELLYDYFTSSTQKENSKASSTGNGNSRADNNRTEGSHE